MTQTRYDRRKTKTEEQPFTCKHCNQVVPAAAMGSNHRNHCPWCLWSSHLDITVGDRRSGCKGEMEPIAVWVKPDDEWAIVHRCKKCGIIRTNRIAGDDNEIVLISLAMRPISKPPFPLEKLKRIPPELDQI